MLIYTKLLIYNRPISPHISIYIPHVFSLFSLLHRISGFILSLCIIIIIIKFNLLLSLIYFNFNFISNLGITTIFILIKLNFFYHCLNGFRFIISNFSPTCKWFS